MKSIKLNIPVLVHYVDTEEQSNYIIRPVFLNQPIATNRRYEQAIRQFQKEIRFMFKGMQLSQENKDYLLWYMFQPELKHHLLPYSTTFNNQFFEGTIEALEFELQGKRLICLPAFRQFIFLLKPEIKGKIALTTEVVRVVQTLFRQYKSEFGKELEIAPYFAPKKTFITTVEMNISTTYDTFKFEQASNNFFEQLGGNDDFDGATETEKVSTNLNERFPDELNTAFYQDDIIKRLYELLFQKRNSPIVIVGKLGIGRHTIVEESLRRYLSDHYEKRPSHLSPKNIWLLDPTRVIAGMSIVGMWQKRLEAILGYIKQPNLRQATSDILMIDNIIALLRIGKSSQNNMTMADVIKTYIEKRAFPVILVATPEEWQVFQEKDRRFSDLFQVIRLQEPDLEKATKIILQKRKKLEDDTGCQFSIQAIDQLLVLQRNYFSNQALPGSIISRMEQLAVKYRMQVIDAPEVRQEFEDFSGLNEHIFDPSLAINDKEVRAAISNSLVGQEDAANALIDVIHTIKARLTKPSKPNASFMFIGPTGVGKTQAAKVLCTYLTGDEENLLRFDMNEYIDEFAVQRLIGDYYNPEGILTGKVRYRPFGIVLFDEIEKAHPKVHDLLLQVLDDGRLTDSLGRTVDFTNTIIIMTSNVGARDVSSQVGFQTNSNIDAIYRKAVETTFRPEFVNRIDRIVIFQPLQLQHILGIARLQIKELLQRDGFVRRTTILNISDKALEWVAKRGFDAKMGGRALKRQIERDLTTLSAEQLIQSYSESPIILEIKIKNGQLYPSINELSFIDPLTEGWLPQLPTADKGKRFFGVLLRQLERVERQIEQQEESNYSKDDVIVITGDTKDLDWQFYDFKEKISTAKQKIQTLMLGFRDRYFKDGPAIPLRFKASSLYSRGFSMKGVRENMRDRLFQQEAIQELSESYLYASNEFDSMQTEFIDCFLDVKFVQLFAKGYLNGQIDIVQIKVESLVNGLGEKEVHFLLEMYDRLLKEMEIEHQLFKKEGRIEAEAHALYALLKGEKGIHLFYASHRNPLPVKVSLQIGKRTLTHKKVIRLYDELNTITDLRTTYSLAANMRVDEFKLLLYAGTLNQKSARNNLRK